MKCRRCQHDNPAARAAGGPRGGRPAHPNLPGLLFFGGWSLGQVEEESSALLERGMRAAEHHGDIGAQVRLHFGYSHTRLTRGRLSEFLEHTRENVWLADKSGSEELRALTHHLQAVAEGFAGNFDTRRFAAGVRVGFYRSFRILRHSIFEMLSSRWAATAGSLLISWRSVASLRLSTRTPSVAA
jgi:hypothetical protein